MPETPKYLPALVPEFRLRGDGEKLRPNNFRNAKPDWPEWVENAAFICWVKANQNVNATKRMLHDEWDAYAPLIEDPETGELTRMPYEEIPTPTIKHWVRRHDWEAKATQFVAEAFPQLNMQVAATIVHARQAAARYLIDVVQGDDPGAKTPDRVKAAEILLITGGAGTHGSKDRLAPVVREVVNRALDIAAMGEEELAELQLRLIREGKAQLPERRS